MTVVVDCRQMKINYNSLVLEVSVQRPIVAASREWKSTSLPLMFAAHVRLLLLPFFIVSIVPIVIVIVAIVIVTIVVVTIVTILLLLSTAFVGNCELVS